MFSIITYLLLDSKPVGPRNCRVGVWVGPRAGIDFLEKAKSLPPAGNKERKILKD